MKAFRARAQMYVALVLLGGLAACGGPSPPGESAPPSSSGVTTEGQVPEPESGAPVDGGVLIGHVQVEPGTLSPILDTADAYALQIVSGVFESLLDRDPKTLKLRPWIAESWEISDDHLTYTFKLRKDVTFSDGVPLTANDVKFTYDTVQNPANETADLRGYLADVATAELLDDYTIRFRMAKPYFKHLTMIGGMPIYPKHIYGEGDFNTHPKNREPIGSGPYMIDEWKTNQHVALRRNPNYWNSERRPHIERILYRIIANDEAALQVLEKQEIHYMEDLTPEQWVNRVQTPRFKEHFNPFTMYGPSGYAGLYSYIAWNMRKPQFSDKMVRRALTMLLDRELILETVYYGMGRIISGASQPDAPEYDPSIAPWPFDPEEAKRLLTEAGWVDTNQDGARDKDGVEFRFEFMIPSGRRETELLATTYQEELKRAGIDMSIRVVEWATFIEFLTQRKFDAVTLSWATPLDQDPYQVWHSSQTEHGSNYPGFKNAEVDKIIDDARVEFDEEKRFAMYRRWHAVLHEEQPYTFLWCRDFLSVVHKRIKGVTVYREGFDKSEWWIPLDAQPMQ